MPYKTEELYERVMKLIDEKKLFFIDDCVAMLGIAKQTFYDHFNVGSDKMDAIKEKLSENRMNLKVSMRKKWFASDHPTLQLALYKIIGTPEEVDRLSGTNVKIDHTSQGEQIGSISLTEDQFKEALDKLIPDQEADESE